VWVQAANGRDGLTWHYPGHLLKPSVRIWQKALFNTGQRLSFHDGAAAPPRVIMKSKPGPPMTLGGGQRGFTLDLRTTVEGEMAEEGVKTSLSQLKRGARRVESAASRVALRCRDNSAIRSAELVTAVLVYLPSTFARTELPRLGDFGLRRLILLSHKIPHHVFI
jgi:hypothetical protein